MVGGSAGLADPASGQPGQQQATVDDQIEFHIDLFAQVSQHAIQCLGLRDRAREAVQLEAFVAVQLGKTIPTTLFVIPSL